MPTSLQSAIEYHKSGDFEQAGKIYQEILASDPNEVNALHLLGLVFKAKGDLEKSIELIKKAIEVKPDFTDAYSNLGTVFKELGRVDEAIDCYNKALKIDSQRSDIHFNLGNAYSAQDKIDEAITCYQNNLKLSPNFAEGHFNLGVVLKRKGDQEASLPHLEKAVEIGSQNPNAYFYYYHLGDTCREQKRLGEAISCFKESEKIKPNFGLSIAALTHIFQQICAWTELEEYQEKLDKLTEDPATEDNFIIYKPLANITMYDDPAKNLKIAKLRSDYVSKIASEKNIDFPISERRVEKDKLTIGYLSSDFANHPVSYLSVGLFGLHDREKFKVIAYSSGEHNESDYRKRVEADADEFVDIFSLTNEEAATRIYQDGVDILVDLNGYTKNHRLGICAFRPAPIQIQYLGFIGSTGASFFDYIITDKVVTPPDQASYYTEKFIYMPNCYQVNDNIYEIPKPKVSRKDLQLPEDAFVFSSLGRPVKIDPVIFDAWMDVLKSNESSVLWLFGDSDLAEQNLKNEASARGVDPERIIFSKMVNRDDYLQRLQLADLVLDTRLFNGGTTTSDALRAGVPVITLQGKHFASRMASSILTAANLPGLIATNIEDYKELALTLSRDSSKLEEIKNKLKENLQDTSLFDTKRFTLDLEKAYLKAWEIFLKEDEPKQIEAI